MPTGRPLRVLYSFPHALGRPGIATTALWQLRGLIARGTDVTVAATSLAAPLDGAARIHRSLVVGGRRVPHRVLGVTRAYRYHDRRVAALVRRRPEAFDLVHTWPGACLQTAAAAREAGIPVVREAPSPHTATAMEAAAQAFASVGLVVPEGHSHRFEPQRLRVEEAEFAAVDAILVPSTHAYATFAARGFAPEVLVRHQYGFDPVAFRPAPAHSPAEGLRAVFAGRGEPSKGLHLALRAWVESGAARHGRLVVCGQILPEFRPYVARWLAHPSIEERGFVDDMAAVMASADILLLPSLTEGSALVSFEAEGAGCVPVVSEATGAPCAHMVDGLVHPTGDVGALTGHLRLLDGDRDLLASLRAGVLARREELTWDAAGGVLLAAYRAVLARSEGRRARALPA
jgi:D-inositol-3-phosphate glycosyltransferase